jgi:hypothetical protein
MFIHQKKNKSGAIGIQLTDKSSSSYKVLDSIPSSSNSMMKSETVSIYFIHENVCPINEVKKTAS